MATLAYSATGWAWRSSAYAWWVVIVLALGLTISLADRMILALMIGPLKHDLHLSDAQVGLLQGFAFTLLYVVAGLPLGRMADAVNRRTLAACSVVAWSVATAACAACSSFVSLFAARLLVGVGEAGLSPVACRLLPESGRGPSARRRVPSMDSDGEPTTCVRPFLIARAFSLWSCLTGGLAGRAVDLMRFRRRGR